jgi:hypothetical protein
MTSVNPSTRGQNALFLFQLYWLVVEARLTINKSSRRISYEANAKGRCFIACRGFSNSPRAEDDLTSVTEWPDSGIKGLISGLDITQ